MNKIKDQMHMNDIRIHTTETPAFFHTKHSGLRASQRGIDDLCIDTVIREGQVIHKQGLKFHFMTQKSLRFHRPGLQSRLANLVVVTATDSNVIVTCYKNKRAIGNIKKKTKRLLK
jgi:hypothetical protein